MSQMVVQHSQQLCNLHTFILLVNLTQFRENRTGDAVVTVLDEPARATRDAAVTAMDELEGTIEMPLTLHRLSWQEL